MIGEHAGTVMEGTEREGRTRLMGTTGVATFAIVPGIKRKKTDTSRLRKSNSITASLIFLVPWSECRLKVTIIREGFLLHRVKSNSVLTNLSHSGSQSGYFHLFVSFTHTSVSN